MILLNLFSSLIFIIYAQATFSAVATLPISAVVSHYQSQINAQVPMTEDDKKKFKLALIARDVFKIESIQWPNIQTCEDSHVTGGCPYNEDIAIEQMSLTNIIGPLRHKVESRQFQQPLSAEKILKIKQNRKSLLKVFNDDSYEKAWFLFQMGEIKESKAVLSRIFENRYADVMQMKEVHVVNGKSSVDDIDLIPNALKPMCDSKERHILDDKVKKMKSYIKRLPRSELRVCF